MCRTGKNTLAEREQYVERMRLVCNQELMTMLFTPLSEGWGWGATDWYPNGGSIVSVTEKRCVIFF